MYSINGIPLDNPGLQWEFLGSSNPLTGLERSTSALRIPGRDGLVSVPPQRGALPLALVVETSRTGLEALLALFDSAEPVLSRTAVPTRTAVVEVLSVVPTGFGDADEIVEVVATLRINGGKWRDRDLVTSAAVPLPVATGISATIAVFPGSSSPIQDAVIRITGPTEGNYIADAGGSWFEHSGGIPDGSSLRIDTAQHRAWVAGATAWTGGVEITGICDWGGGRNGEFEIVPQIVAGNPSNRQGVLDISHISSVSSANRTVQVRGRGAYVV